MPEWLIRAHAMHYAALHRRTIITVGEDDIPAAECTKLGIQMAEVLELVIPRDYEVFCGMLREILRRANGGSAEGE